VVPGDGVSLVTGVDFRAARTRRAAAHPRCPTPISPGRATPSSPTWACLPSQLASPARHALGGRAAAGPRPGLALSRQQPGHGRHGRRRHGHARLGGRQPPRALGAAQRLRALGAHPATRHHGLRGPGPRATLSGLLGADLPGNSAAASGNAFATLRPEKPRSSTRGSTGRGRTGSSGARATWAGCRTTSCSTTPAWAPACAT
jgi:hypothetical protein